LPVIVGDYNSLSTSKPIGFDDDLIPEFARSDCGKRFVSVAAYSITRGRHAVTTHEIFRERLARFELRRQPPGTKDGAAASAEQIRDATRERCFGTNHRQVDAFLLSERQHRLRIAGVNWEGSVVSSDTGVSRRAQDLVNARILREPPTERVLARAAADNEDSHVSVRK